MNDNLPPLPPAGEHLSKWAYDENDMQAYARAAIEKDRAKRQSVPAEVLACLDSVDDFIARCNGDDRDACEPVNTIRRLLAAASQPAPPSQFGSSELGAMILAKCIEKDQQPQPVQQEPLSDDASPVLVLLAVEESIKNGGCPWQIEQAFEEYESQRQAAITKGTT